jgi:hypothetical protein
MAVSKKLQKLGLTKKEKWTEEELEILSTNYQTLSFEELSLLLPKKSKSAIANKASKLNQRKFTKWTDEEKELLWFLYPVKTMSELLDELPNKNEESIRSMAKHLGLSKEKQTIDNIRKNSWKKRESTWSQEDLEILQKSYSLGGAKEVSKHLKAKRTIAAIVAKANQLGLYYKNRNQKEYVLQHKEVINENGRVIRKYIFEIN